MRKLALLLLFYSAFAWGECSAVKLNKGEFIDHGCRLFRRVRENDTIIFEKLAKDRSVLSREVINCSKATFDPAEGQWYFRSRLVDFPVWCPRYLMKQEEAQRMQGK